MQLKTLLMFNVSRVFVFLCLTILSFGAAAQSNPLDKMLVKGQELLNDGKFDDAEKYVVGLLKTNPDYGDGWDLLAAITYKQYEQSKALSISLSGGFSVEAKDENGKKVKGADSLLKSVNDFLKDFNPKKKAYNKFLYTMRKATCSSREAYQSSVFIRTMNVDVEVDSNVSKKALKYFSEAEAEFANKNYNNAATLYKRACEEQPDFYKAHMYLGDCYYATKNYTDAIISFKAARDKFPFLLEPRKYLIDAYGKTYLYDKCVDEAVQTMLIYPDLSMLQKLEDAAYMDHRKVDIKWTPRAVLPNVVEKKGLHDINSYTDGDDTVVLAPWIAYTAALEKISSFCDTNGIVIKPTGLTRSKYLEVYSWEEMLKNSIDPALDEARRMQKLGYLDCYVLVSCFHYDFYNQYRDFVTNNKDRVVAYFKTFTKTRQ